MADSNDIRAAGNGFDTEKGSFKQEVFQDEQQHIDGIETSAETSLHRGLKARHIAMVAMGGAIGTGLLVNTGLALAKAGPAPLFIAYSFVGILVYMVMAGMGEMAAWLPLNSGFTGYASRYCHKSLGFTLGWTYWCKYIIVTPNQLTAAALIVQFWVSPQKLNPGIIVAIFLVLIFCINYFGGVRFFGEAEFWMSSLKVCVILGIILFSIVIASRPGNGFHTWRDPGAFAELYYTGSLGRFVAFWSVMVNAAFAFLGVELCGLTSAEAQNPRRVIPKAIRLTFFRILVFYILSVLLVGLIVPYNSPELKAANKHKSSASASPFVVAAKVAGIHTLPSILNACLLIFVFSAATSDLYVGSRTLYGLACDRSAPAIFRRVNSRGVPTYALFVCTAFCCLAFMVVSNDASKIFSYFVNTTTIFGLLTWISLLVAYIFFLRARRVQGIPDSAMPYVAPQGLIGTYITLFFCSLVALTKNFDAFIPHDGKRIDVPTMISGYIGIPVYLAFLFGHMIYTGSRAIKPQDVDFFSGKDIIDREEELFLEQEAQKRASRSGWNKFYDRYISWLF
ncbi:hypothetical protein CDD82_7879 [Ophiocordyceps australis]|uniref:Amino acid permease/ SLC12A domain-containing protein n=1 Tax=Ophiocordyceps australis TaxID=1399860 RepID=A0A2C5ZPM8_9HYPO|nr:hypothetical protein CDD82_7879 [Ophiocordyceps australis]